jgi:hypothetical protein
MLAGAVAGPLTPKPIWALCLGALAGQLSYQVLFLKVGPLLPLSLLFLVGYSPASAIFEFDQERCEQPCWMRSVAAKSNLAVSAD